MNAPRRARHGRTAAEDAPKDAAEAKHGPAERVFRKVEALVLVAASGSVVIWLVQQFPDWWPAHNFAATVALCLVLLSLYAVCRAISCHFRYEYHQDAEIAQPDALLNMSIVMNTLRHHLGNKLAVTVGYGELVAEDPRLPEDLREHAEKTVTSAHAAADSLRMVEAQLVNAQVESSVKGPLLLAIGASNASGAPRSD